MRDWSIRKRLAVAAAVPALVLAVVIAAGIAIFNRVKIGSEPYRNVTTTKDLISDVRPPVASALEAYLTTLQLALYRLRPPLVDSPAATQKNRDLIADLRGRLQVFERDFFARHDYWRKNLAAVAGSSPAQIEQLLAQAYDSGTAFFDVIDHELLPQIDAPAEATDLRKVLTTLELVDERYAAHRGELVKLDDYLQGRQQPLEAKVRSDVGLGLWWLLAIALGGLAIITATGLSIGRSIRRGLRVLSDAATRTARDELPAMVESIRSGSAEEEQPPISPIVVKGASELQVLSDSFNAMRETAIDLATDQARQRVRFAQSFVDLARRNQSLLNHTLELLADLKREARDSRLLNQVLRVDRLVTRLRRNAASLLVLAGAEAPRLRHEPVALIEVLQFAVSEIEASRRITINALPSALITGRAARDLGHLLAELLENAAEYSPPGTTVDVYGRASNGGGLTVFVVDQGIGMAPHDYEAANERLSIAQPPDEMAPQMLGLYVVGRLGARHGVTVRLGEAPPVGTVAEVRIPPHLLHGADADPFEQMALPPSRQAGDAGDAVTLVAPAVAG